MAQPQLIARRFKSKDDEYVLIEDVAGVGFYRLQSMEQGKTLYESLRLIYGGMK